jgi:hypothetical protein
MTQPIEEPTEAGLASVTNEEWLEAHAALVECGMVSDFPEHELTFVWDPDLPAHMLIHNDEVEQAPHG